MSIFGHTIDGLANGLIATSPNRKMEGSASTSDVVRSNETLGETPQDRQRENQHL